TPTSTRRPNVVGSPDTALAGAAKVVEAEYEVPFQGHTAFSPAHALADPSNGQMTIYSNDMKSYRLRRGVAEFLGMPKDRVRVVWMPMIWETPLRTGNLRDPNGPQVTFAAESFIDELAAAAETDPLQFRLKLLGASTAEDSGFKRARSIAVVKAAAETYGWDNR